jgi:hypothetical protein
MVALWQQIFDFNFGNILLSITRRTTMPKIACRIENIIIKPIPGSRIEIGLRLYSKPALK